LKKSPPTLDYLSPETKPNNAAVIALAIFGGILMLLGYALIVLAVLAHESELGLLWLPDKGYSIGCALGGSATVIGLCVILVGARPNPPSRKMHAFLVLVTAVSFATQMLPFLCALHTPLVRDFPNSLLLLAAPVLSVVPVLLIPRPRYGG
jgi:hypothetical protein